MGTVQEKDTQTMAAGVKHDEGKTRFDLVPPNAIWEIGRVMTFGSQKYGDRNWEKGIAYGRLFAAAMRHLWSWWRGEDRDNESGIHHLAHAGACVAMMLEFSLKGKDGSTLDDRQSGDGAAIPGARVLSVTGRG
jgi:hypothetical protein